MRKNKKGVPVVEMLLQLLCFFMDGTSRHLTWFDELKKDESYAPLIGCQPQYLASSHAVKRFFGAFSLQRATRYCPHFLSAVDYGRRYRTTVVFGRGVTLSKILIIIK